MDPPKNVCLISYSETPLDSTQPTQPVLRFVRSFANHWIHSMNSSLHFFPDRLVYQLLPLHGSLSFKHCRNDFNFNVWSIRVVIGSWIEEIIMDMWGSVRLGYSQGNIISWQEMCMNKMDRRIVQMNHQSHDTETHSWLDFRNNAPVTLTFVVAKASWILRVHVATTVLSSVVLIVLATNPRKGRLVDAACVEKARAVADSIMISTATTRAIVMVNGDEWISPCSPLPIPCSASTAVQFLQS